MQIDILIAEP